MKHKIMLRYAYTLYFFFNLDWQSKVLILWTYKHMFYFLLETFETYKN